MERAKESCISDTALELPSFFWGPFSPKPTPSKRTKSAVSSFFEFPCNTPCCLRNPEQGDARTILLGRNQGSRGNPQNAAPRLVVDRLQVGFGFAGGPSKAGKKHNRPHESAHTPSLILPEDRPKGQASDHSDGAGGRSDVTVLLSKVFSG